MILMRSSTSGSNIDDMLPCTQHWVCANKDECHIAPVYPVSHMIWTEGVCPLLIHLLLPKVQCDGVGRCRLWEVTRSCKWTLTNDEFSALVKVTIYEP